MIASVADAIAQARSLGIERVDAQRLLSHVLGRPRSWLLAHDDALLDAAQAAALHDLYVRSVDGEPVAYLLGSQAFHGLDLRVDPRVLIPRSDTEVLVDWAIELLERNAATRVIDLGTGSGAVALAIKRARPQAQVFATDVSADALQVARTNALRLALEVDFLEGAWWQPAGDQRFDLVLSNPPYIEEGDVHLGALRHEPRLALTSGGDGLDALRTLAAGARAHLNAGAWILLEHGRDQAEAVQALLREEGLADVQTRLDLGGRPRCTGGRSGAAKNDDPCRAHTTTEGNLCRLGEEKSRPQGPRPA